MPLFKQRVSVQSLWEPRLSGMFSGKNEPGWDALKRSFHDPAMDAVDSGVFYAHMQAITIQIVNIAIAKSCSIDISVASKVYVDDFLRNRGHAEIGSLVSLYSKAFGSSASDGVREMAAAFSRQVANSQLAPATVESFCNTLYLLLRQIFDLLGSTKLVP